MQTTSHFIGLKLKSMFLSGLYVRLQQALGDNLDALEFQNILSAHITLFYLPKELSIYEIEKIHNIISDLDIKTLIGGLKKFEYFGEIIKPRLCYLVPNTLELTSWNTVFQKTFPEYLDIPDNTHPLFIPHVTLFKIRNLRIFNENREVLENIINNELGKLITVDIFDSIHIFEVNSQFHPEIQIEIPL